MHMQAMPSHMLLHPPSSLQQQLNYGAIPVPARPSSALRPNQNLVQRESQSGRVSPGLKRGYDDAHHMNAHAAAAAVYLSQQQAEEKRMRLTH